MAEGMKANPDYQLVMRFLELIQPGDMDEDSANQLMMIGQRIQNGGALSDKEREMFESVVGAMPANPTPPPATSMGQMTDADQRMAEEEGVPSNGGAAEPNGWATHAAANDARSTRNITASNAASKSIGV